MTENNIELGKLITLKDAAWLLGVSYGTALRLVHEGKLEAVRVRSSIRTTETACMQYLSNHSIIK